MGRCVQSGEAEEQRWMLLRVPLRSDFPGKFERGVWRCSLNMAYCERGISMLRDTHSLCIRDACSPMFGRGST